MGTDRRRMSLLAAALLALSIFGVNPAPAAPQTAPAPHGQEGADLLDAINRGERKCSDLDQADFVAVGEFAMQRMLGTPAAHEGMDRMIASMMGEDSLDRVHEAMGVRFAGCGNPQLPGSFGGMMGGGLLGGMMGGFGPGVGGGSPNEDGAGFPDQGYGPWGMMGFDRDGDDDDAGGWIALGVLILVAVAIGVMMIGTRPGRHSRGGSNPAEILAERFARGEIDAGEYAERRRLLDGGGG